LSGELTGSRTCNSGKLFENNLAKKNNLVKLWLNLKTSKKGRGRKKRSSLRYSSGRRRSTRAEVGVQRRLIGTASSGCQSVLTSDIPLANEK
jgi:hypothetical protein